MTLRQRKEKRRSRATAMALLYMVLCFAISFGQNISSSERECLDSIADSDTNQDESLNEDEFSLFRQDLCNLPFTNTSSSSIIETSTFFALACVCQQDGGKADCCNKTNANIDVNGVSDFQSDTIRNDTAITIQRLDSVCLVVRASCSSPDDSNTGTNNSTPSNELIDTPSITPNLSRSDIPSLIPDQSDLPSIIPSLVPTARDTDIPTRRPPTKVPRVKPSLTAPTILPAIGTSAALPTPFQIIINEGLVFHLSVIIAAFYFTL